MRGARPQSRNTTPAIPAALLAAAVVLSVSSAADVTVAAVLMNRQAPSRNVAQGESLSQWLSRFTDAARQMRGVLTGDEAGFTAIHAAAFSRDDVSLALELLATIPAEAAVLPYSPPMIALLTDLPPPLV